MNKNSDFTTRLYEFLVYFIDVVIVIFSIYITFMVKFNFNPPRYNYDSFVLISPWIVMSYLVLMFVFGLSEILKQTLGDTVYSVFLTIVSLMFFTSFITFFLRGFSYPRTVLVLSTVLQFFMLSLWRCAVWKVKRRSHGIKKSLVIGNASAEYISKKILIKQRELYKINFVCNSSSPNIIKYMAEVDVVFLCNDVDLNTKRDIVDRCLTDRKSIYIIPDIYEIALLGSKLNKADDIPMLKLKKLGMTLEQRAVKRLIDIVISIIGIVLTSPIMLIMAIIIKTQDGGNIFYKQERVTVDERAFNVFKFRTMVMNAEKLSGPVLAGEDDPRITKVGRFMRSTRIDELPQLFNILDGDMSLVGPRPERPYFVEKFKSEIPDYKYRTIVKAGLTGLAQVWGKYTTTPEDKVRYDIIYIKNYSIILDIKLILQTIKIVFTKESSAGLANDELSLEELASTLRQEITVDKE